MRGSTAKRAAGDSGGQPAGPIAFEDPALTLFGKLEKAAESLLSGLLPRIAAGGIPRRPNEIGKGSYYGGRKPEDGRIDWTRPAVEIYNLVRAAGPPAAAAVGPGDAGRRRRLLVGTGKGLLSLEEVEWKGVVARGEEIVSLLADAGEGRFA